jgi:hypothetical protein
VPPDLSLVACMGSTQARRYGSRGGVAEERPILIMGQALQPVPHATTVRVSNGKLSATDGHFAETNEQLGGFMFIEARDLNEAIQIA